MKGLCYCGAFGFNEYHRLNLWCIVLEDFNGTRHVSVERFWFDMETKTDEPNANWISGVFIGSLNAHYVHAMFWFDFDLLGEQTFYITNKVAFQHNDQTATACKSFVAKQTNGLTKSQRPKSCCFISPGRSTGKWNKESTCSEGVWQGKQKLI